MGEFVKILQRKRIKEPYSGLKTKQKGKKKNEKIRANQSGFLGAKLARSCKISKKKIVVEYFYKEMLAILHFI